MNAKQRQLRAADYVEHMLDAIRLVLGYVEGMSNRLLKNVMSDAQARKKATKKRSLHVVNEHFESLFDAVSASVIVLQQPAKEDFLADKKTQQAVILNIIVIGEAATQTSDECPDFAAANSDVPWKQMRGMRNRMAHGYFEINLDVVWDTVQQSLPELRQQLLRIQL